MKAIRSILSGLVCSTLLTILAASAQAKPQDYLARIQQAKVGLFAHYVFRQTKGNTARYTPMNIEGLKPQDPNELADAFDPKKLADFAEAMGAEYVIFTAFHAGMNMLYPSQVMGEILPEKESKRDVIRELQDAMDARGNPAHALLAPDGFPRLEPGGIRPYHGEIPGFRRVCAEVDAGNHGPLWQPGCRLLV